MVASAMVDRVRWQASRSAAEHPRSSSRRVGLRAWSSAAVVLACVTACGESNDDDDGGTTNFEVTGLDESVGEAGSGDDSTGSSSTSEGSTSGDGDGDATGDGDGDLDFPICLPACTTVADCTAGTLPAYDADNYSCDAGGCVYNGCNNDQECADSSSGVCRPSSGQGVSYCTPTCATAADCDLGTPAYDADNYSCDAGACVFTGCNTDQECAASNVGTICHDFGSIRSCANPCSTAADCGQGVPAFDADNYACESGICTYTGCNSDQECSASGSAQVCR